MKYIRTISIMLFMGIALWTCLLTSCSRDEVQEEESVVEEVLIPEPEPHWADGTITIETGIRRTAEEIVDAIWAMPGGYTVGIGALAKPDFPMSHVRRTVEISVVTLEEVDIKEPLTYNKILKVYESKGYRPLTLEEALETRAQFRDQPGRTTKGTRKMKAFYTLLSEGGTEFNGIGPNTKEILLIERAEWGAQYGVSYRIRGVKIEDITGPLILHPDGTWEGGEVRKNGVPVPNAVRLEKLTNTPAFACVKVN